MISLGTAGLDQAGPAEIVAQVRAGTDDPYLSVLAVQAGAGGVWSALLVGCILYL